MLPRTGDGDIEQPSLFLQFLQRVGRTQTGKQLLLKAHDKDGGKLQALGGMDGHQTDAVIIVVVGIGIGL